jgi:hypothetical protein
VTKDDVIGFGPAMIELLGVYIVKQATVWESYREKKDLLVHELVKIMKEKVSLSDQDFSHLLKAVLEAYKDRIKHLSLESEKQY